MRSLCGLATTHSLSSSVLNAEHNAPYGVIILCAMLVCKYALDDAAAAKATSVTGARDANVVEFCSAHSERHARVQPLIGSFYAMHACNSPKRDDAVVERKRVHLAYFNYRQ